MQVPETPQTFWIFIMMKHSLIAIAALTAVGSACAESSVSLYGIVDTAYQFSSTVLRIDPNAGISTRTETQKAGLVSGVLSGSRARAFRSLHTRFQIHRLNTFRLLSTQQSWLRLVGCSRGFARANLSGGVPW